LKRSFLDQKFEYPGSRGAFFPVQADFLSFDAGVFLLDNASHLIQGLLFPFDPVTLI